MFTPISHTSFQMVTRWLCMAKVSTWKMSLSIQLIEGLLKCDLLSINVWLSFEVTVPLLNLCEAHGIFTKSLLNLLNNFHLGIDKYFAKLDKMQLIKLFQHFMDNINFLCIHYTQSHIVWLPMSDVLCWQENIHTGRHIVLPYTSRDLFISVGKIKVSNFYNGPCNYYTMTNTSTRSHRQCFSFSF